VTVNKDRVELFAAALESDRYRQCRGQLKMLGTDPDFEGWKIRELHCALGVATQVALDNGLWEESPWVDVWSRGDLNPAVAAWYGWNGTNPYLGIDLGSGEEENIASANDFGLSFWQIAQAVRAKWLKDEG